MKTGKNEMKEENQKKSEAKNQNETFENRYLRPRSGPNLNSQKPISYPPGFKPKAVTGQTTTISRPQSLNPDLKDLNPSRPKVVAHMKMTNADLTSLVAHQQVLSWEVKSVLIAPSFHLVAVVSCPSLD